MRGKHSQDGFKHRYTFHLIEDAVGSLVYVITIIKIVLFHRLNALHRGEKMSCVPEFGDLDRLLCSVMSQDQFDTCSKRFSDPSQFFLRWRR